MVDIVKEILLKEQRELDRYKPITISKHLEVRYDVGMLLCADPNDLDTEELRKNKEEYLRDLTRDNTQLLVNEIWQLPTERVEECIVARLPAPTTTLPRTRKVPGPKLLTKWEKFAKEKGIKKSKRDKKVWDEVLQKWIPTYGFKRAQAEKQKDWAIEVPENVDPMENMFQKKTDLRNEKVAKNEIQRMKNIMRAKKIEIPRSGYAGPEAASSSQLSTAATIAKASTASVGKFQEKLSKEKVARGIGVKELIPGSKRKASHISEAPEKEENLELIRSVLSKRPKINVDKAISLQKQHDRQEREQQEAEGLGKKKSKSKGNKSKGKAKRSSKKPKGNGQRAPGKKSSFGRKRR